jgi:hypothetical protein
MATRRSLVAAAILILAACARREDRNPVVAAGTIVRAHPDAERSLLALIPSEARAGEVFQRQPNGLAALAVLGTGFTRTDVIFWDGHALGTTFGSSRLLSATLPPELLANPREVEVAVESPDVPKLSKLSATFRLTAP